MGLSFSEPIATISTKVKPAGQLLNHPDREVMENDKILKNFVSGWKNFIRIESFFHHPNADNHANAHHKSQGRSVLSISLKLTFQYFHVATTCRPLSSYQALIQDVDNDFKKFTTDIFEQNVKTVSMTLSERAEFINTSSAARDSGEIYLQIKSSDKYIKAQKCFLMSNVSIIN